MTSQAGFCRISESNYVAVGALLAIKTEVMAWSLP